MKPKFNFLSVMNKDASAVSSSQNQYNVRYPEENVLMQKSAIYIFIR